MGKMKAIQTEALERERLNARRRASHRDTRDDEPSNERTARAMNDSGAFRPFVVVGNDD
jgi:hypothetical protein